MGPGAVRSAGEPLGDWIRASLPLCEGSTRDEASGRPAVGAVLRMM